MPKYHNHFKGHLPTGDPRTPVTGAGGCAWPTVPPVRLMLYSSNAVGEWEWLQRSPIILEQNRDWSHHNYVRWEAIEKPWQVYWVIVEKYYVKAEHPSFRWIFTILLHDWPRYKDWTVRRSGHCNTNVTWGALYRELADGNTGRSFTQYQVEFDKQRPPGWGGP